VRHELLTSGGERVIISWESERDQMSEARKAAVNKYDEFLRVIENKIALAISTGKSAPTTKLAKEVGPSFGWEWQQAYHMINSYIDERADLYIKYGPRGGACLKEGYKWNAELAVGVAEAKPGDLTNSADVLK
jgi:hypothetical protein